jgi:hypothetical protein
MKSYSILYLILLIILAGGFSSQLASALDSVQAVDIDGVVGMYTSLALDSNGFPVVSYYDNTYGLLKVLHCNDPSCMGEDESIQTVDSNGIVGLFTSLVLDANGFPVISYYNFTSFDLKVVHCNDVNCAGNDESIQTVDFMVMSANIVP